MNLWNSTRTFALASVPLSPNDSDEKWGETYLQLDINSDKKKLVNLIIQSTLLQIFMESTPSCVCSNQFQRKRSGMYSSYFVFKITNDIKCPMQNDMY